MNFKTLAVIGVAALGVGAAGIGTGSVLSTAGPLAQTGARTPVAESPTQALPPTPTPPPARDAVVTTIARGPALKGPSRDGPPGVARFNEPGGLALGTDGSIYVADFANRVILRIDAAGNTERIAGSGEEGTADGPALSAQFTGPTWIAVDSKGVVYEYERLHHPSGITVSDDGSVYIADTGGARLLELQIDGSLGVVAGTGLPGFADGPGSAARLDRPTQIAWAAPGTLFFTDRANAAIRKVELG